MYLVDAEYLTRRIREESSAAGISMAQFIFQKFIDHGVTMSEIGGIISGNRPYLQHKHLEIFAQVLGDVFPAEDDPNKKNTQAKILINRHKLKNSLYESLNFCGLEYGDFTFLLITEGITIPRLIKIMAGATHFLYENELEIIGSAVENHDFLIREVKAPWEE